MTNSQVTIADREGFSHQLDQLRDAAARIAQLDGGQKVLDEVTRATTVRDGLINFGPSSGGTPAPVFTNTVGRHRSTWCWQPPQWAPSYPRWTARSRLHARAWTVL